VDAADDLAHLGVGSGSHRARIEDGNLAILSAGGFGKPRSEKLELDRRAVCLARPASEIEEVECRHGPNFILPGCRGNA